MSSYYKQGILMLKTPKTCVLSQVQFFLNLTIFKIASTLVAGQFESRPHHHGHYRIKNENDSSSLHFFS
jgi:hypothetical protein